MTGWKINIALWSQTTFCASSTHTFNLNYYVYICICMLLFVTLGKIRWSSNIFRNIWTYDTSIFLKRRFHVLRVIPPDSKERCNNSPIIGVFNLSNHLSSGSKRWGIQSGKFLLHICDSSPKVAITPTIFAGKHVKFLIIYTYDIS